MFERRQITDSLSSDNSFHHSSNISPSLGHNNIALAFGHNDIISLAFGNNNNQHSSSHPSLPQNNHSH